ncbi:MAG: glycosyltransferase family 2 protein [Muribaculaceae bacterium]|nr:glycosyltransferase family 2 protein [Muribaculaceae bacterium]
MNQNKIEISIIIPFYNASRYLNQCITSIINQSFKNIEILLINDGSTDNSQLICEKFANQDCRIKITNKIINEGSETARFSGLKIAKGNYIFFIDGDDWLDNLYILEKLYLAAEELNTDYVEIGMQRVLDSHKIIKNKFLSTSPVVISNPQLFEDYFISFFGFNKLSVSVCGKLYRKSSIEKANIQPLGIAMGEDLGFNLQLFPHLNNILLFNQPGYNYRIGGLTSRYNPHFLKDMKRLFYFKEEMIKKYDYKKAIPFTRYELKNVLKSEICQKIIYKKGSKKDIIRMISNEIEDPIYKHLYEINSSENFWINPFVIAFKNKDAKQLLEICNKEVIRKAPIRFLKNVAFKILNT